MKQSDGNDLNYQPVIPTSSTDQVWYSTSLTGTITNPVAVFLIIQHQLKGCPVSHPYCNTNRRKTGLNTTTLNAAQDQHILGESGLRRPVRPPKACSPGGILDRLRPSGSDSDGRRVAASDEVHEQDGRGAVAPSVERCLM